MLRSIAARVTALADVDARVLVAVDGPDAAGKTTLADALVAHVGTPVVRASIDDFHRPAAVRSRRGDFSPDGYYLDAFDHDLARRELLEPFRRGAAHVRTKAFDSTSDSEVHVRVAVPTAAVLVVDGVFLQKPSLAPLWTMTVYLHVAPVVTLRRALVRDAHLFGTEHELRDKYERRYLPAQARYRKECDPIARAHVVIDNTDPANPAIR